MIRDSIIIFTDGSSRGNPGPGGFGAVIVYNDSEFQVESEKWKVQELGGGEQHTTNNRMELQAAISVLSFLSKVSAKGGSASGGKGQRSIVVYCDSSYVINGITKWVFGWQKNGWKTATKKVVENRDLWEKLIEAVRGKKIEWKQVGGHVGVVGNERCDEIATAFADGNRPELYSGVLKNYRIKNILDVGQDAVATQKKSSGRAHSRAAAYSYVSAVDGAVETHKTWAECEKRVKGTSGAKYKKALSAEDEKEIIAAFSVRK